MRETPFRRFRERFFPTRASAPAPAGRSRERTGSAEHEAFRPAAGQGPFLPSCDGRIIPLRKAKFLRKR
jgi:hypothetical protein